MHYVDGLSFEEIASLLGSSPGAVRVRLHRARRQLREELAPLAPTPSPKEEIIMIEMTLEDVIVRVAERRPAESRLGPTHRVAEGDRWRASAADLDRRSRRKLARSPPDGRDDTASSNERRNGGVAARVTGARVDRVAVTSLREKTFYAVIAIAVDGVGFANSSAALLARWAR